MAAVCGGAKGVPSSSIAPQPEEYLSFLEGLRFKLKFSGAPVLDAPYSGPSLNSVHSTPH